MRAVHSCNSWLFFLLSFGMPRSVPVVPCIRGIVRDIYANDFVVFKTIRKCRKNRFPVGAEMPSYILLHVMSELRRSVCQAALVALIIDANTQI